MSFSCCTDKAAWHVDAQSTSIYSIADNILVLVGAKGKETNQVNVFDEHSTNGTSIDGARIKSGKKRPSVLKRGQTINFGKAPKDNFTLSCVLCNIIAGFCSS